MINKYIRFNEAVSDFLKGPNKEEIKKSLIILREKKNDNFLKSVIKSKHLFTVKEMWEIFGYENILDTPREFLLEVIDGIKLKEQNKYPESTFWEKDGQYLFELNSKIKYLWVNYNLIWFFLLNIFNMNNDEITTLIKDVVNEKLNWDVIKPYTSVDDKFIRWGIFK